MSEKPYSYLDTVAADRALAFAVESAAAIADVFCSEGPNNLLRLNWPQIKLGSHEPEPAVKACRDLLAPFVRSAPDAPVQALFAHARMTHVHSATVDIFHEAIPFAVRAAYSAFREALLLADRMLKEESARLAEHIPSGRQAVRPSKDGHALERLDGREDRAMVKRDKPIPRTLATAPKPTAQPGGR